MSFLNKPGEFPLAEYGITQVEPCKLDLLWMVQPEFVKEPVVKWPVVLKLKGAERVGYAFKGV